VIYIQVGAGFFGPPCTLLLRWRRCGDVFSPSVREKPDTEDELVDRRDTVCVQGRTGSSNWP